jgi:hypothetical protein
MQNGVSYCFYPIAFLLPAPTEKVATLSAHREGRNCFFSFLRHRQTPPSTRNHKNEELRVPNLRRFPFGDGLEQKMAKPKPPNTKQKRIFNL